MMMLCDVLNVPVRVLTDVIGLSARDDRLTNGNDRDSKMINLSTKTRLRREFYATIRTVPYRLEDLPVE
jgi:hypothetical protein